VKQFEPHAEDLPGLADERVDVREQRGAEPAALLDGLTEPQRAAVVHRDAPLLVIAGAGSGKTRVLTRRIAHLMATGDARAFEILAITFTNKAADEMRSRVVDLVGPVANRMWVATFHSACVRILRATATRVGYEPQFTIYDASDSLRLFELVMDDLNVDKKRLPPRSVASVVSQAKAEVLTPEEFSNDVLGAADPFRRRIGQIYTEYQRRLRAANAMDFDDLLMVTVQLLRSCPDVLESYQERFRHILVDEFQDTNRAQNELVLLLGQRLRNVCVVGDSDQSIYRFRAADIRNILDFETTFSDATTILLEQNFRSTQNILDAANAVISHNTGRKDKRLFTEGEAGPAIKRYRAEDEHDEAAWIATEIRRLEANEGLQFGDVAIFYRTNAQSRVIEEELVRARIPYKVIGGTRFYDRKEIKDVLAYVRLAVNPRDEVSARRIINVPKRGIGATSITKLGEHAARTGRSFGDAASDAADAGLTAKALRGATAFAELMGRLRHDASESPPGIFVERILEETGYRAELEAERTHESEGRLENLAELVGVAASYETLDDFLNTVALVADSDELGEETSRVSLMTLHIAKGLEYPAVFLIGLEDGIFPHFRSLGDPAELEEERRLAYVGLTRARRHLTVSHAWVRSIWGQTQHNIPSRFLGEIPAELFDDVNSSAAPRLSDPFGRDEDDSWFERPRDDGGRVFGSPQLLGPPSSSGAHLLELAAGDRVVHERWGEGTVLSVTGSGDRSTAVVRFADVGDKTLMLSMAPLKKA
jgi:DNA helicase II / ATP-dependent DNA helicase PcrA